jgi:hypothetical protein
MHLVDLPKHVNLERPTAPEQTKVERSIVSNSPRVPEARRRENDEPQLSCAGKFGERRETTPGGVWQAIPPRSFKGKEGKKKR